MAIAGALQASFDAPGLLAVATPNALPHYHPMLQSLFTQLAGGWLLIAFHDIVTLRAFSHNRTVWRCVLGAGLVSDACYVASVVQDLGVARFINPVLWTKGDWLTITTTLAPMAFKTAFVLGVGMGKNPFSQVKEKDA